MPRLAAAMPAMPNQNAMMATADFPVDMDPPLFCAAQNTMLILLRVIQGAKMPPASMPGPSLARSLENERASTGVKRL